MIDLNKIYTETCETTMARMPDNFVDCIVTSPPYWQLRDYGVDGQIGLEDTPEKYIYRITDVFNECRRVLKPTGTLWLNLGDSYSSNSGNQNGLGSLGNTINQCKYYEDLKNSRQKQKKSQATQLPIKNLIGIPWRVALALQADGWYLRQDIIWHKPNPMPESVKDRCTKAHEYLFMLSKNKRYYYDQDAIAEPGKNPIDDIRRIQQIQIDHKSIPDTKKNGLRIPTGWDTCPGGHDKKTGKQRGHLKPHQGFIDKWDNMTYTEQCTGTRNKRSVWTIATQPFPEAHFATFPVELPRLCIAAGCPEGGVVYDPFGGAGTVALAALQLERNFILSELNPEYVKIANKRIAPLMHQHKFNF